MFTPLDVEIILHVAEARSRVCIVTSHVVEMTLQVPDGRSQLSFVRSCRGLATLRTIDVRLRLLVGKSHVI